jgi:hypothetical protein
MSTELSIHLWLDPDQPEGSRLADVVDAVLGWEAVDGDLEALTVREAGQARTALDAGNSPARLRETATAVRVPEGKLSTGVAAHAWRFRGGESVEGHVRVGLEAWGPGYSQRPDPRLDGDALVWLQQAGPYVKPAADAEGAQAHAEENLLLLTGLLLRLVEALEPRRLAVHTSEGMHHPLNAHAVWVPHKELLLQDLATLHALWTDGCEAWRLPPLSDPSTPDSGTALHAWRPAARRREVWEALGARIDRWDQVEPARVDAVLGSGRFDYYDRGEGVLILEVPWMLNAFVDDLYLALLGDD